jgi:transposase
MLRRKLIDSKIDTSHLRLTKNINNINKEFKPFWNEYHNKLSENIWLPNNLEQLNLTTSNSDHFRDSLKLSIHSTNITSNNNQIINIITKDVDLITRKIRIYPNKRQIKLFTECLNCRRFIANEAISLLNSRIPDTKEYVKDKFKEFYEIFNHIKLRNLIGIKDERITPEKEWLKRIPYATRDLAIKSVISMYNSAITNLKRGNIKKYKIDLISKKENIQIFDVDSEALNIKGGLIRIFSRRFKETLEDKIERLHKEHLECKKTKDTKFYKSKAKLKEFKDRSILRTRKRDIVRLKNMNNSENPCSSIIQYIKDTNSWYICIPYENTKVNVKDPIYDKVFLDPGVRTFQKCYSPEGIVCDLGENYYNKHILSLLLKSDKTEDKKLSAKLRTKAKHITNDLHKKTCGVLTNLFDTIIIPDFKTSKMVKKSESNPRKINKYNVRALLQLAHYKFRETLKFQCKKKGRTLHVVTEEFTSMTCGRCGNLHKNLGSSKIYNCNNCGLVIDRDLNGSRNICLKYMELVPSVMVQT